MLGFTLARDQGNCGIGRGVPGAHLGFCHSDETGSSDQRMILVTPDMDGGEARRKDGGVVTEAAPRPLSRYAT
ncbi:hypothetical protein SAMN04488058_12053 [Deinococcus reticulitermitis]|uniref:Uncharacterized protein n=1 Tax=Deinococcus reticulitermitis TaxID=856736 RepID=A0A1H7BX87_9DEIO|nr:hypothetical protein SAMN04488058_12053 [Deinococcus reticulitermitis]